MTGGWDQYDREQEAIAREEASMQAGHGAIDRSNRFAGFAAIFGEPARRCEFLEVGLLDAVLPWAYHLGTWPIGSVWI